MRSRLFVVASLTTAFDVNNARLRQHLLKNEMMSTLGSLTEQSRPLWGEFTPQQMVEHLLWTFEFATGDTKVHRDVPPQVAERLRPFLYDDRPTPRDFKNPLLVQGLPPLRFRGLAESKLALQGAVSRFFELYQKHPDAIHDHPLFGSLNGEDWERALFKHCYHHLLQFGLIETGNAV